ncbi:hypothetical protein FJTKL_08716 [Diaporthe vaccinii]|uniref:Uncharacterized protein n=1 Tax=Diaporthe vaccinii TaxID=105482 RepID=A0ABR4EQ95_9PEZI
MTVSNLRHNRLAAAGAAGIMIEDQTWPKRCGHTAGKSVVSRSEAYARWQAAVGAKDEGQDIWILERTDSLILGYDEAIARARKAIEIGVDAVFVEALPDRETMAHLRKDLDFPLFANIIEGGKTDNLSAKELGELGYSGVAYPWTLVAAKLRSIRETLEAIKGSFMVGKPPNILSYAEVCEGVGFNKYFALEERYQHEGRPRDRRGTNGKIDLSPDRRLVDSIIEQSIDGAYIKIAGFEFEDPLAACKAGRAVFLPR